jgi:putative N6-adenine-specific DNA methylase
MKSEIEFLIAYSSLSKRIKRHVVGKRRAFFAATPPHANRICADELRSLLFLDQEPAMLAGGVEFEGKLTDCYLANLKLRTANRILMRAGSFEATNFLKLEKQSAGFPWELYVHPDMEFRFSISAHRCRLYHKEAIRERLLEQISARLSLFYNGVSQNAPHPLQTIYIRGVDDRFFLSLDTSGEILYKRGIKTHGGKAPMRETTAAAILHLAGYTGQLPLIDPMCGSGTLSLEAAMIAANIPPGWFREFAFMQWPSYTPATLEHIKREAGKGFIPMETPIVFASDIDPSAVNELEKTASAYGLDKMIHVSPKDFFEIQPGDVADQPGFIFINPPYGIRMETQNASEKLFREIVRKLKSDFQNWTSILVVPSRKMLSAAPFGSRVHPIFHGGLNLSLSIGKI